MDWGQLVPYAAGVLIAIGYAIFHTIRTRRLNARDPLQARLAELISAYTRSAGDDAAFAELRTRLSDELRARHIGRSEWQMRVFSATSLVKVENGTDRARKLIQIMTQMRFDA